MISEQPTQKTSSAAPEEAPDPECACAIKAQGWWQGAVVEDATLRAHAQDLPLGATHWIVASQTCNLFNDRFDRVRRAEWLGASSLDAALVNSVLASGSNPRRLHCRADGPDGTVLHFDCDIQLRHWTDRRALASMAPLRARLQDCGADKQKDGFIGWIARSYTRIELSDELNAAIEDSTVATFIKNIIRAHKDRLYGIFLRVAADSGLSPTEAKPCAEDECTLEIFFVTDTIATREQLNGELKTGLSAEVGNPLWTEGSGKSKKVPRLKKARHHGLLVSASSRFAGEWSLSDTQASIRYSMSDHFSDSGAAS